MSEKQNIKTCKRYSSAFECRIDAVALCAIEAVKIRTAYEPFLVDARNDCLCMSCLNATNTKVIVYMMCNLPPLTLNTLHVCFYPKSGGNSRWHYAFRHSKNKSISPMLQCTIQ